MLCALILCKVENFLSHFGIFHLCLNRVFSYFTKAEAKTNDVICCTVLTDRVGGTDVGLG